MEDNDIDIGTHLTGRRWLGRAHPSTIHVLENGPVRLVIEVKGKLLDASTRSQQIVLYQDLPRIDLATSLDWEGKRDVLLYQMFPLAMPAPTVRYAVPYGWEEYGKEMKHAAPWFSSAAVPVAKHRSRGVRGWIELAHGRDSIALASQCNYAAFKDLSADPEEGFLIQPLLLRTVRSCGDNGRLYYEQKGRHEFRFALQSQGDPTRLGEEADSPLLARWAKPDAADRPHLPDQPQLSDRLSLLSVEPANLHVTAVKRAEDGRGLVVRLVELRERAHGTTVVLRAFRPIASVTRTNIIEEDEQGLGAENRRSAIRIAPAGIETLRIGF